jgi:hypothetical protein
MQRGLSQISNRFVRRMKANSMECGVGDIRLRILFLLLKAHLVERGLRVTSPIETAPLKGWKIGLKPIRTGIFKKIAPRIQLFNPTDHPLT